MSQEERKRAELMKPVRDGALKLGEAAEMLAITCWQVERVWRKYRRHGAGGLAHGNAGKVLHRTKPAKLRKRVLGLIWGKYSGEGKKRFGPTLAPGHLASEHGVEVNAQTLWRDAGHRPR